MDKNIVTSKHILTIIIVCWATMIFYTVVKLVTGMSFDLTTERESVIKICNYLDNTCIKYIIATILYSVGTYLFYLTLVRKHIGQDLPILILIIPTSIIKCINVWIGTIIELCVLIIIPLLSFKLRNWRQVVLCNLLLIGYQSLSLFIRNLGHYFNTTSLTLSVLLSIDYYIMLILHYLYNRKEVYDMGWIGPWLFGEKDEVAVRKIMKILDTKDYEKVKAFYIEMHNKPKGK